MSNDMFRIERGLEIDSLAQYLVGSGTPGSGPGGDTNSAPVGSVYTNTADGSIWTKITPGSFSADWQRMASETYVNNALGSTVTWREPALVRDAVSTTVPVGTPSSPIIVDGVSVGNGGRVLFSSISGGGGKNVYVYNLSAGTFAEDSNNESSGDSLYIQSGTSAGKTYVFNGTSWVQTDQASVDELGFVRSFVGKASSGSSMPTYTTTNFVVAGSALATAVSALDTELGANVSVGNFVSPSNKINANIQVLDIEIGANVTNGNFILAASKINANIQALDAWVGPSSAFSSATYISNPTTLSEAIAAVDSEAATQGLTTNAVNVTTSTVVDTTPPGPSSLGASGVKWIVRAYQASNPANMYATELFAISDGSNVDYTKYATLLLGSAITGLSVTAGIDVGSGNLELLVASTAAVNVTAKRVAVLF